MITSQKLLLIKSESTYKLLSTQFNSVDVLLHSSPVEDDITTKGAKIGSWNETNPTLFIYKAYTYIYIVYVWCENTMGDGGTIRENVFTKAP